MAEAEHLPVAPYNSDGPMLHFVNAHFSTAIPNLYVMEAIRDRYDGWHQNFVTNSLTTIDGVLPVPDGPGLGTSSMPTSCITPRYPFDERRTDRDCCNDVSVVAGT